MLLPLLTLLYLPPLVLEICGSLKSSLCIQRRGDEEKRKLKKGSASKEIGSGKVAFDAQRGHRGFLIEPFSEVRTGDVPFDVPPIAPQVSPVRDSAVTFLIDDSALVADWLESSPSRREDDVDEQLIVGGSVAGSAEEEPSSSGADWAIQVLTYNSGLLLRKGDNVAVLGEGNFSIKLEEFEKLL